MFVRFSPRTRPAAVLRVLPGLLLAPLAVSAQTLFFQNGGSVEFSEITISGTNLQRATKKPNGTTTTQTLPASAVTRVDWPQPPELLEAEDLILQGKYEEALAKASAVQAVHRLWKDKPGSWYAQASLLVAESQIRLNRPNDAARLMSELRTMNLPKALTIRVGLLEALEQFQKGITGPALAKVNSLLKGTEDSSTMVRIYLLLGDIQFKREAFEEALNAYLHVSVFYGAQAPFLPAAELGAARSLMRLRRLKDATDAFNRVTTRYAGSPEAEAAKRELASLRKASGGGEGETQ